MFYALFHFAIIFIIKENKLAIITIYSMSFYLFFGSFSEQEPVAASVTSYFLPYRIPVREFC